MYKILLMIFVESFPPIKHYRENMTDEEFKQFCAENPDWRIECDKDKNVIAMAPTYSESGRLNGILFGKVFIWNEISKLGETFDSSTGFKLPNGATRSPDVSWIAKERWEALPQAEKEDFAHICPDFCIELRSKTDRVKRIKAKLEEYIENGCRLGWLVDPVEEAVRLYRQDGTVEIVKGFDKKLSGENVLPGFEFDLQILTKKL